MEGSLELPISLLCFVATVVDTNAEILTQSSTYRQHKGELGFNFTTMDQENIRNELQCFRACNEDSGCIGVGVWNTNGIDVRCVKMNNNSNGDSHLEDALVFLKGMF